MPSPEQSLEAFLAELEAEYAKLGDQIAFIRQRLGLEPGLPAGENRGPAPSGTAPTSLRSDTFFGMSLPEAIKALLAISKKPQQPKDIENAVRAGGFITTAARFDANIHNALMRLRRQGEIVSVPGGWGLTEWYKGRANIQEATAKKKGPAKKGARKAKRAVEPKPPKHASKSKPADTPKHATAPEGPAEPTAEGASADIGRGAYLKFQRARMKEGKTMAEAAAEWRALKATVTPDLPFETE